MSKTRILCDCQYVKTESNPKFSSMLDRYLKSSTACLLLLFLSHFRKLPDSIKRFGPGGKLPGSVQNETEDNSSLALPLKERATTRQGKILPHLGFLGAPPVSKGQNSFLHCLLITLFFFPLSHVKSSAPGIRVSHLYVCSTCAGYFFHLLPVSSPLFFHFLSFYFSLCLLFSAHSWPLPKATVRGRSALLNSFPHLLFLWPIQAKSRQNIRSRAAARCSPTREKGKACKPKGKYIQFPVGSGNLELKREIWED